MEIIIFILVLILLRVSRLTYTKYMKLMFYRLLDTAKMEAGEKTCIRYQVSRLDTRFKDLISYKKWRKWKKK